MWIKCTDRMPPEGKCLASFLEYGERRIAIVDQWLDSKGSHCWIQDSEWVEAQGGWNGATKSHESLPVTHWQPLPEPPTE